MVSVAFPSVRAFFYTELAGLYESLGRLCLDLCCSVIKQGVLNAMLIKANDTSRTIEGGTMLIPV